MDVEGKSVVDVGECVVVGVIDVVGSSVVGICVGLGVVGIGVGIGLGVGIDVGLGVGICVGC